MSGQDISRRQALALLGAGAGIALSGGAFPGGALAEAGFYRGAPMLKAAVTAVAVILAFIFSDWPRETIALTAAGFAPSIVTGSAFASRYRNESCRRWPDGRWRPKWL